MNKKKVGSDYSAKGTVKNQKITYYKPAADRAYLLFEGKILFQGTSEELAENPVVREKYLGRNFIFRRKKFD